MAFPVLPVVAGIVTGGSISGAMALINNHFSSSSRTKAEQERLSEVAKEVISKDHQINETNFDEKVRLRSQAASTKQEHQIFIANLQRQQQDIVVNLQNDVANLRNDITNQQQQHQNLIQQSQQESQERIDGLIQNHRTAVAQLVEQHEITQTQLVQTNQQLARDLLAQFTQQLAELQFMNSAPGNVG